MAKKTKPSTTKEATSNMAPDKIQRSLQEFLITRFIVVLFVSATIARLTDVLVYFLYSHIKTLFYLDELNLTGSGLVISFTIVSRLLLAASKNFFPTIAPLIRTFFLDSVLEDSITPASIKNYGALVVGPYYVALFFIFVILLAIAIAPYIIGIVWYFKAISHEVQKLRDYDYNQRLEYERQRNLMLANLAHDIKTPVTTVVGYSKALADGIVPTEKVPDYLQTINSKSMRISDLINMLFDYSKIDSIGFELHPSNIDIGELVLNCLAECYTDFEEHGINLDIRVPEEKMPLCADSEQLTRVIHNLLSNAIKYIGDGDTVIVSMAVPSDKYPDYRIAVSDNGTPIDDELAEHIFEPFARGDSTRSTTGGSGLGLSIAKRIVELHGGTLLLNNHPKHAMTKTFIIKLPVTDR